MNTFLKALWIKMNATREANISSVNLERRILRKIQRKLRPGDVADKGTGVKGHEQEKDDGHPDSDPEAQAQIVPVVRLTKLEEDFLKDVDRARRTQQVERLTGKE